MLESEAIKAGAAQVGLGLSPAPLPLSVVRSPKAWYLAAALQAGGPVLLAGALGALLSQGRSVGLGHESQWGCPPRVAFRPMTSAVRVQSTVPTWPSLSWVGSIFLCLVPPRLEGYLG